MLARCMIPAASILAACSFHSDPEGGPLGGSLTVSGQIVDFQTGAAVEGSTSLMISGLEPAPRITSQGASFTIEGVPENAAFQILASAAEYRPTFGPAVVVTTADLDGVQLPVVSNAFVTTLAAAFKVTLSAESGIVLVHLVDAAGKPRAGVAASELAIGNAQGPFFLDAALMPALSASASTSSGWAVFFEVPAGLVGLQQPPTATVTIDMAVSPLSAGAVTIAEARVTDGAVKLPVGVKFEAQIMPIFSARGCVLCHSGNGPGKDLGGLQLDGGTAKVYKELVEERPNTRVQVLTPEKSLVLTMPSREIPPDGHPTVVFASSLDPDYLKLLVWIREGALQN
ncbi:MAG TPA: hypothetical protein VFT22_13370 [Kofleriaceae bacterium]|nr:hypothetical protein [Kofleriaceae bacterium]